MNPEDFFEKIIGRSVTLSIRNAVTRLTPWVSAQLNRKQLTDDRAIFELKQKCGNWNRLIRNYFAKDCVNVPSGRSTRLDVYKRYMNHVEREMLADRRIRYNISFSNSNVVVSLLVDA